MATARSSPDDDEHVEEEELEEDDEEEEDEDVEDADRERRLRCIVVDPQGGDGAGVVEHWEWRGMGGGQRRINVVDQVPCTVGFLLWFLCRGRRRRHSDVTPKE